MECEAHQSHAYSGDGRGRQVVGLMTPQWLGYLLPTNFCLELQKGRRDPARGLADVWTCGNRVFRCAGTSVFRVILSALGRTATVETEVAAAVEVAVVVATGTGAVAAPAGTSTQGKCRTTRSSVRVKVADDNSAARLVTCALNTTMDQ